MLSVELHGLSALKSPIDVDSAGIGSASVDGSASVNSSSGIDGSGGSDGSGDSDGSCGSDGSSGKNFTGVGSAGTLLNCVNSVDDSSLGGHFAGVGSAAGLSSNIMSVYSIGLRKSVTVISGRDTMILRRNG